MKKLVKSFFNSFGVEIRKLHNGQVTLAADDALSGTMYYGLKRMKERKIEPATVIDLGAAQGKWTLDAMKLWPLADYLLIEPLQERKAKLEAIKSANPKVYVANAAAGNEKGTVDMLVSDDLDGSGMYDDHDPVRSRKVEVITIDDEVQRLRLQPPYLIKFDTHGFEMPILKGSKNSLKDTELIVMECYGFRISKICLTLHEMVAHMETLGFRMADVVDVMRRPGDGIFWQCDVLFLPSAHPFFKRTSYAE